MVQYIQTQMRKEPITLLVMLVISFAMLLIINLLQWWSRRQSIAT